MDSRFSSRLADWSRTWDAQFIFKDGSPIWSNYWYSRLQWGFMPKPRS